MGNVEWGMKKQDRFTSRSFPTPHSTFPIKSLRMLSRILEPEVMDTYAEARDYDSMDHAEVNRRFVDDLLAAHPFRNLPVRLLDLGTGTAQIPIELCRRAKDIHVTAADAARHMLDLANHNVDRAGLQDQITLELADAKKLTFADGTFDGVISNSIIHHIPEPLACLQEAARVTRTGGLLYFRDLLRPSDQTDLERLVNLYAPAAGISSEADHQRTMFAESLHAALSLAEIQNLVSSLNLTKSSVEQTSDRHWTWLGQK
jgi:ubiquinone/menaquinone biosynthesis C-methylase UbiE